MKVILCELRRMSKKPKKEVGKVVKKKSRRVTSRLKRVDVIILVSVVALIIAGMYLAFFGVPSIPATSAQTVVTPLEVLKKVVTSVFVSNYTNTSLIVMYSVRGNYALNTSLSIADSMFVTAAYNSERGYWFAYYDATPYMRPVLRKLGIESFQEDNATLPPKVSKPEELLINVLRLERRNASLIKTYLGDEDLPVTLSTLNLSSASLNKINTVTSTRATEVFTYTVTEGDSSLTITLWVDKETRVPLKARLVSRDGELIFTLTSVGLI